MSASDFQLLTPRLILRDFVPDDWSMIYALSREPQVIRYQTWLRLANEDAARTWVQNAIESNRDVPRYAYNLAIVADGTPIGWIGWGRASTPAKGDHDFGYALAPQAWGNGYMTEALRAAVDFMFESLGSHMITGDCEASNHGSARVMQKAGLRLIEQWHERDEQTGVEELHSRYAIHREEWARERSAM